MLKRFSVLAVSTLLAACGDPPAAAPSSEDLTVTIRVQNAALDFTRTFVHRGDERHKCLQLAQTGYSVVFGPDPSTLEQGGSTVPMGSVVPGLPPLANPVVNYFSLQIEPMPSQPTAGPPRLSRSFAIGMTARGAWEGRYIEGESKTSGSVTLDPGGVSGRFRLSGVEPHLAHGRMAPSEHVTVTGSWRCPRSPQP